LHPFHILLYQKEAPNSRAFLYYKAKYYFIIIVGREVTAEDVERTLSESNVVLESTVVEKPAASP